uniref:Uncharacterized protein MANES_02G028800 n=1 Tax=Rhizophora mucronata TaxID=61149 RepID=A0A2P2J9P6_RHIMU
MNSVRSSDNAASSCGVGL